MISAPSDALNHVYGSAVGIDFTRRDRQSEAKAGGKPWDIAKAFDFSGPVGPITAGSPPQSGKISLSVDGEVRQNGDLSEMIWSNALILSHLSKLVRLNAGDVIFTGTPAGVGPIAPGQTVKAEIAGLCPLELTIT